MQDVNDFNIVCWCGSGKEFKDCHSGRENNTPLPISEEIKKAKKIWNKKYCLHPSASRSTCRNGIIKAHSVQRGMLDKIAVKGHVYAPQNQFKNGELELIFKRIGISDASVFNGFCGFHDNETFKNIEEVPFSGTAEQCFLYGYRAVCRELFLKRAQNNFVDFTKTQDAGKTFEAQSFHQDFLGTYGIGVDSGQREIENLKTEMDKILLSNNYDENHYCIIWLKRKPEILCSAIVQLDFDFLGDKIQDWTDLSKDLDGITLSVIVTDGGGAAVFTWHKNSNDKCLQLIQSLVSFPTTEIPNHIVNFVVKNFENFYLSPIWWEGLDLETQESYKYEFMDCPAFLVPRNSQYLSKNRIKGFNWDIQKITSNAFTII